MLGMEIRLGLTLTIWFRGIAFGEASLIVATSKAGLSGADSRCGTADGTVCRAFTLTTNRQAARIVTAALTRLNAPKHAPRSTQFDFFQRVASDVLFCHRRRILNING